MKKITSLVLFVLCTSVCYAQKKSFDDFVNLFQKVELPFVIDSCSVEDFVVKENEFPNINADMKTYIPDSLSSELFKEQNVRAYYNVPINENYISLILFAGSFIDDYRVTNSIFYLLNYDTSGNIIDFVKIASFICEGPLSWCSINNNMITYNSFELYRKPISFEYKEHEVAPMVETRLNYKIDTNGHFIKDILFNREGLYKPTYEGCVFEYCGDFPKEEKTLDPIK